MKFAALFDPAVRTILPDLGVRPVADGRYVTELTGIAFRDSREAVIATGRSLIDLGLTKG